MWDNYLRNLFSLCDKNNRFVFEVCDLFGSKLTVEELEYWLAYGPIRSAAVEGVDITGLSYDDAVEAIQQEARRRKDKWKKK